jgi:hypothetical protein
MLINSVIVTIKPHANQYLVLLIVASNNVEFFVSFHVSWWFSLFPPFIYWMDSSFAFPVEIPPKNNGTKLLFFY